MFQLEEQKISQKNILIKLKFKRFQPNLLNKSMNMNDMLKQNTEFFKKLK